MAYGLEVWDAAGRKTLSVADTVGLVVAYGSVAVSATPGAVTSFAVPKAAAGDWLFITQFPAGLYCEIAWAAPTLTITSRAGSGTIGYVVVR